MKSIDQLVVERMEAPIDTPKEELLRLQQELLSTPGNQAVAICHLVRSGNWCGLNLVKICDQILSAQGDLRTAIAYINEFGWLQESGIEFFCERVVAEKDAMLIYLAKKAGWWKHDDETTIQMISSAEKNRGLAITLAKLDGWWPFGIPSTIDQVKTIDKTSPFHVLSLLITKTGIPDSEVPE